MPVTFEQNAMLWLKQFEAEGEKHFSKLTVAEQIICNEVAKINNIPTVLIFINKRPREIVMARNMAVLRLIELFEQNLKYIGGIMWLNPVDHSTVINARDTCKDDLKYNANYRARYQELVNRTEYLCEYTATMQDKPRIYQKENMVEVSPADLDIEFIRVPLPRRHREKIGRIDIRVELKDGSVADILIN